MRASRIRKAMNDVIIWQKCTLACQLAFIKEMRGLQYGLIETQDAFMWFLRGWKDAIVHNIAERCGQLNSEQHQAEENTPNELALVSGCTLIARSVPYL